MAGRRVLIGGLHEVGLNEDTFLVVSMMLVACMWKGLVRHAAYRFRNCDIFWGSGPQCELGASGWLGY